jgi:hypothetical protein
MKSSTLTQREAPFLLLIQELASKCAREKKDETVSSPTLDRFSFDLIPQSNGFSKCGDSDGHP